VFMHTMNVLVLIMPFWWIVVDQDTLS
jgi:hypothetical protein